MPLNVSVPAPILVRPTVPPPFWITPAKVVLVASPTVSTGVPDVAVTVAVVLALAKEPICSL